MKLIRVFTTEGESQLEELAIDLAERDGTRTVPRATEHIVFADRPEGSFIDFHNAPRRQFVLYLTASVEVGVGDGTTIVMEPEDVLLAEDVQGRGHTSRVVTGGVCAFVPLAD